MIIFATNANRLYKEGKVVPLSRLHAYGFTADLSLIAGNSP
jgi:hypothetical protein